MALWRALDGKTEAVTRQIVFDDYTQYRQGLLVIRQWFCSHTAGEARQTSSDTLRWDGANGAARLIDTFRAVWLVGATTPTIADEVAHGIRSLGRTNYWSKPELPDLAWR